MELNHLQGALEAVLFAHGEPVSAARLADVFEMDEAELSRVLAAMRDEYEAAGRGICLLRLEDSWQLATKPAFSSYVKRALDNRRNTPLSPAAMEVLAVIAYNQPVSRSFVEQVRGVDSTSTVQTLLQKGLIEEAGRLDLPGRPISFRTTDAFLRSFGLESLAQLPPLHGGDYMLEPEVQAAAQPEDGAQEYRGPPQGGKGGRANVYYSAHGAQRAGLGACCAAVPAASGAVYARAPCAGASL